MSYNIKELSVLLTSVGGLISPGIIENLKCLDEVSKIIGVDASLDAVGFHMVDKYFIVPYGNEPEYIQTIFDIVEKEGINLIIPCSDEEVLALSYYKKSFKEKGVAVLCPEYETVATAIDKGYMLSFLKNQGIHVPEFYLPKSVIELEESVKTLGYPTKPVVVKPRRSRGGRGLKILQENVDILTTRNNQEFKLSWYIESVKKYETLEVVVMEYLPGEDYSVDILADRGKLLFVVPRKRIKAILGPSQVGQVVWNKEIVDMVTQIVKVFEFSCILNIQLRYSVDRGPLVYEINPRVSGTIVAGKAAGVDLLKEGIRYVLGLQPSIKPMTIPVSVRMVRYLKEYFIIET